MIPVVAKRAFLLASLLLTTSFAWASPPAGPASPGTAVFAEGAVSIGKKIYREGRLPSGELLSGRVMGDVSVKGNQVICTTCHRRSGMGSTEGQEVVPAITGDLLYEPLRLPTSQTESAPILRPAHTDESLRRAIRDGIGADGRPLGGFMPRYPLGDADLDSLIAYLKSLDSAPATGVTETEMHFATIVTDRVDPATRKALLDVLETYFERKNAGTRHETERAANAPWHKEWLFKPYRKWRLHVWELSGPQEGWERQLVQRFAEQPVFAVVSGVVPGDFRPVHDFCERARLPCLFPTTDLPVVDEFGFYTLYLSAGMSLEARVIARHLTEQAGQPVGTVVEVLRPGEPRSAAASGYLQEALQAPGVDVVEVPLEGPGPPGVDAWTTLLQTAAGQNLVLWLGGQDLGGLWEALAVSGTVPARIYLSSTLYDISAVDIPLPWRQHVFVVHPFALPAETRRLLARSTGWLRSNRIHAPEQSRVQANAFFALKATGEAAKAIRSFFNREYLIERIEHMLDNATYTAMYPHVTLAPGQRFVSKGAYIGQFPVDGETGLKAASEWIVP